MIDEIALIEFLKGKKYTNVDEHSIEMTEEYEKEHAWELSRNTVINSIIKEIEQNFCKITKEKWICRQLENFESCCEDVIRFIANVLYHNNTNEKSNDIISLFSSGFCYHFAVMLQNVFGGDIYMRKGYGHIVWKCPTCKYYYDIEGVFYDFDPNDMVPITEMQDNELYGFIYKVR